VSVFDPARVGQNCEFCGSPEVVDYDEIKARSAPGRAALPHRPEPGAGRRARLVRRLWLAPGKLKRLAQLDQVRGVYLPYWTFDAEVHCPWTAEAGYYHDRVETYRDARGVSQRRTVRQIEWRPRRGWSITASTTSRCGVARGRSRTPARRRALPHGEVVPYDKALVQGFVVEHYQVVLVEAAQRARKQMEDTLSGSAPPGPG